MEIEHQIPQTTHVVGNKVTHLFQTGNFTLHSGGTSTFRIECDALSQEDWVTVAEQVAAWTTFQSVEGVSRGGISFAVALQIYASPYGCVPLLIVDDVFTTGGSMEQQRNGRDAVGVVLFARGKLPKWIYAMWKWGLVL